MEVSRRIDRRPAPIIRLSIAFAVVLVAAGCLDASSAARPVIELAEPGEESTMTANVKREGTRVWVEGVPDEERLGMLGGLGVLLRNRGEHVTLNELMAYSGDAFHLSFADKWQFMGYMAVPTNIVNNVLEAFGYEGEFRCSDADMPADTEGQRRVTAAVLDEIRAEIDRGRPVLVGGCSIGGCFEWSVVVGYDRENRELCHVGTGEAYRWTKIRGVDIPLNDEEMGTSWNAQTRGAVKPDFTGGWTSNARVVLGKKVREPDPRERTLTVLRRAVELHTAPTHDPGWGWRFHFGQTAYQQWAEQLHGLDYPADLDKPQPPGAWDLYDTGEMARMVDYAIVRGRTVAAAFCERAAEVLPEAAAPLRTAATAYREEVQTAKAAFAVFLEGITDKERAAWLSEKANCQSGARAIHQMLAKERAAIAEIEKALAAVAAEDQKGKVRREDGKLVLDGFPTGTEYQVRGFGELLALRDCLRYCGADADWNDLLGYSGDAFGCDNMSYDSVRSHDVLKAAAESYGFTAEWRFGDEEPPFGNIRNSLAEGTPCIVGGGHFGTICWHFPVVIGEDRKAGQFLVAGITPQPAWLAEPTEDGVLGQWNGQVPWGTGAHRRDGIVSNWQSSPRFVLGDRKARPPADDRLLAALRLGVSAYRQEELDMYWADDRWRSQLGRAYLVEWPKRLREWSSELRGKPIDPNDGDPLCPGYFNPIAISVRRKAGAAFLRKHKEEVAEPARAHLDAAAGHYQKSASAADRMFERLYGVDEVHNLDWYGRLISVRFYIGEGKNMGQAVSSYAKAYPDRWAIRRSVIKRINKTFTSKDAVEQACRLADEILKSDDAAIAEIEKALVTVRVEREGDRLVLKGFPTGTDYHVRGFGELLALQDCLEYLGVEADWTDLLGYSGDAFGCDGMTDLAHLRSHDVVTAAAESYGFGVTWGFDRGRPSRPQVHEVLSKGTPVVACGARLSPWDEGTYCAEWTVILGDDAKEQRILLGHGLDDYAWGLATYHWFGRVPWATGDKVQRDGEGLPTYWQPLSGYYLGERHRTASPAKRFLEAMGRAVMIHRTERVDLNYAGTRATKRVGRGFLVGWADDLRRWAEHIKENPDDPAWHNRSGSPIEDCYFGLVAHSMRRREAAAFLRRHSSGLSPSAQTHVESAAAAYEMSAELSEGLFRQVASTDQVEGLDWHGRLRYGPDSLDDGMGEPEDSQLVFLNPPVGRTAEQRASAEKIAERISQQLLQGDVVEAACRTVRSIRELDDTAIAEIERALVAQGAMPQADCRGSQRRSGAREGV